jgi:uncharacterized membrane protein YhaH (DUF805 family)
MGQIDLGKLLFTFDGRINRGKFWLAALIYFIVGLILGILGFLLEAISLGFVATAVGGITNFVVLISGIAVGIKRLHDRNKSGWWLLFFYLALPALAVIGFLLNQTGMMGVIFLAAAAIFLWMFIELACLRGTIGPNRFGPDPVPAL